MLHSMWPDMPSPVPVLQSKYGALPKATRILARAREDQLPIAFITSQDSDRDPRLVSRDCVVYVTVCISDALRSDTRGIQRIYI